MGLIYYDALFLRDLMRDQGWDAIPVEYRGTIGPLYHRYELLGRYFEPLSFLDRSNTIGHFLKIENVCPFPDFSQPIGSFADLCARRAIELGRLGREIVVFWSGGIDSTALLLAFFLAGYAKQLRIVMTHLSIIESPKFYERFIAGRIEHEILATEDVRENYSLRPDQILVTGELGDQIFGSLAIVRFTMNELMSPWTHHLGRFTQQFLAPMIEVAPIPIKTLYDVLWWINFTMKWQNVKYRFIVRAEKLCTLEQLNHFYDTDYFQQWSVRTEEPKIIKYHRTYKWTAKQYIFKHNQDEDYLNNKMKVSSLRVNVLGTPSNPTFFFADGTRVTLNETN